MCQADSEIFIFTLFEREYTIYTRNKRFTLICILVSTFIKVKTEYSEYIICSQCDKLKTRVFECT